MHPYKSLPDHAFWRKSVAGVEKADVNPMVQKVAPLTPTDKVVTAGSCFAQHISKHLSASGFNFYVPEQAHPLFPEPPRESSYGVFSARYGNIYTSRQLLQLFQRAYGIFEPEDQVWRNEDGHWIDPFRPAIEPEGFATEAELIANRDYHLSCVRNAFENLDYFVFTLGLTECWQANSDGAVFPVCPGVSGGEFDPERYSFVNLTFEEIFEDMDIFFALLREVNPKAKVILTVSPVPLVATASENHVLTATTLSKAILRTVADRLTTTIPDVVYFPSFEIITGAFTRGSYFEQDLRSVTKQGVQHVMRIFMQSFTDQGGVAETQSPAAPVTLKDDFVARADAAVKLMCEEELLDKDS